MSNRFKLYSFLLFSFSSLQAEQFTDSFRLDGYANVNMREHEERKDSFKLSGGFQGRYEVSDNMSITGQVHFKEGHDSQNRPSNSLNDYDAELKWLYLDYYLQDDITLRFGAFQFPIFKSSETGDIGYTYTWTETPLRFYGVFGCDDYEGMEVLKNFSYKDYNFLAQVSYGKSTNELSDGRGTSRNGEASDLFGLTLKTSHDDFLLTLGYIQAKSSLHIPDRAKDIIDHNVKFNMIALESEIYIGDYTVKTGFIKTNLNNIFPEDIKYYTSLEYNYKDFTPYILYSKEILKFKDTSSIQAPVPDKVVENQSSEKYSIGLRYDINENMALKVSYTYENDERKYGDFFNNSNDNNSTLMSTINVVF